MCIRDRRRVHGDKQTKTKQKTINHTKTVMDFGKIDQNAASMNATWNGGPTYKLQRQHIPGYEGHVKHLISENLYARPYAKLTGECLNERVKPGFIINEKERLVTSAQLHFDHPNKEHKRKVLQQTAEKIISKVIEEQPKSLEGNTIDDIPPIDRMPIVGYQGFRPVYMHPLRVAKRRVGDGVEPLAEGTQDNYRAMRETFKESVLASKDDLVQKLEDTKIPVVGYAGFVPGVKAKNMYGKSYNEIASASKILSQNCLLYTSPSPRDQA
eukprot:TRINITY_DN2714_c0_g1_i5.p1 TRINITY_DN2714_c0_g1~~TRINITY_DN2714_c0_g1_i5.p1  ORF type:complete len:269 (+),score=53.25 TRINITY_DN2714_c0_g1_i5:64-870(+)